MRGAGPSHVGSLRAAKMLYDDSTAAFEETRTSTLERFPVYVQHLNRKALRRARLSFDTCPRADTSIEKNETMNRCERSAMRGEYLSDLYV